MATSRFSFGSRLIGYIKLISVEPGLLAFYLGIFFLYTAFHPLVYTRTCDEYARAKNSTWSCGQIKELKDILEIQSLTSHWISVSSVCFSLPSIVVDILLGSWGDKYGRKIPIILPSIGGIIAIAVYIVVEEVSSIHVGWICLGSMLAGLCGGPTGAVAAAFSYITVITDETTRTTRCAILEAMSYVAGTVAPFIAGSILKHSNRTIIFALSGSFYLLNIIYSIIFIKEPEPTQLSGITNPVGSNVQHPVGHPRVGDDNHSDAKYDDDLSGQSEVSVFSLVHLKDSIKTIIMPRQTRLRIWLLLIVTFLIQMLFTGELDILYLFLNQLGLEVVKTEVLFSYVFGGKYLMASIALLIFLPLFRLCGLPDHVACGIGILSEIGAFMIFGFSNSLIYIIVSLVVGSLSAWAISTSRALLSKTVPDTEIGKLFGIVAVLGDLALLLGALFYNNVFPILSKQHLGATHFTVGGLLLVPLLLLIFTEIYPGTKMVDHTSRLTSTGSEEEVSQGSSPGRTNPVFEP